MATFTGVLHLQHVQHAIFEVLLTYDIRGRDHHSRYRKLPIVIN